MPRHKGMLPHDIVVLLKILLLDGKGWRIVDLAEALQLTERMISLSLQRSAYAHLLDATHRIVNREAFVNFLLHGLPVVFPTQPGTRERGMPTAHSAPPLREHKLAHRAFVWPDTTSSNFGLRITPLYPQAPQVARTDALLYELLALIDAIRAGDPVERGLAGELLTPRILEVKSKPIPQYIEGKR
jgi:hypothetical protein